MIKNHNVIKLYNFLTFKGHSLQYQCSSLFQQNDMLQMAKYYNSVCGTGEALAF